MFKIIAILLFANIASALEIREYKKKILSLSSDQLWELKDKKFKDNRVWYFSDGSKKKVWSIIGACKLEDKRTCKDCTCDYYFKSYHPHNRFKGDYPYNTFSEGYPQSPNKLPSSGCMQVNGHKGTCSFNNAYKLCNLSNNPKVVFKAYVTHAFNDSKDPCGLKEFVNSEYAQKFIDIINSTEESALKDRKEEKKKGEQTLP